MKTFQDTIVDVPGHRVTVHIGQADGRVRFVVHNRPCGEQVTLDVPADACTAPDAPHGTNSLLYARSWKVAGWDRPSRPRLPLGTEQVARTLWEAV